ncbi:hypothetical protein Y032_0287g1457 [Ancylostoma ceylanicum]|uniref:Uncharacterized protein n=1 Tax=Ancylostoma ceylanicum TaxID=53326 RepID=A0A016S6P1_9BILA|nr:hypothetical protein Y032_0287g1457 [Ancylostoma ceylanicum]
MEQLLHKELTENHLPVKLLQNQLRLRVDSGRTLLEREDPSGIRNPHPLQLIASFRVQEVAMLRRCFATDLTRFDMSYAVPDLLGRNRCGWTCQESRCTCQNL